MHRNREKWAETSSSGHNAHLDDFLRLETHAADSDLDIDEVKGPEGGLRDIHLEDSRQFTGTMYHIHGIPETWLGLVSPTTRLANILDATKYGKGTGASFLNFLQRRASCLENIMCSFALKDAASEDEDGVECVTEQQEPNYHVLRAMNSALVILFYRRVRNVNPLILQGHVGAVAQSLKAFDAAIARHQAGGPGSAWPAFLRGM